MANDLGKIWATVAVGVVATACGYSSPYRSSGPSLSKAGVAIAVVGQRCYVNRTGEPYRTTVSDDELNVELRVDVRNQSSHTAVVEPQRMVVSEMVDGKRADLRSEDKDAVTLQPGESKTVSLRFGTAGDLDCHHELALDAGSAITVDGQPVSLDPVRFSAVD
jgi:hypothetical protein